MSGMDEWQRLQNEKIALMGTIDELMARRALKGRVTVMGTKSTHAVSYEEAVQMLLDKIKDQATSNEVLESMLDAAFPDLDKNFVIWGDRNT
ncbi:hypothetical protein [Bradyrhizobium sp. USDA 4452]